MSAENIFNLEKEKEEIALVRLVSNGVEISEDVEPGAICFCGSSDNVRKRRLNTRYESEESNWLVSCYACFAATVGHYNELWDVYYSGCL